MKTHRALASLSALLALVGCERNATYLPNGDASLNKPADFFREDAANRFPYPASLPRGADLPVQAEIGYMWNVVQLVNYSGQPWDDVELWVNRKYVVGLNRLEAGKATRVAFKLLYDNAGNPFPNDGQLIEHLELKKDGAVFDVPSTLGN